LGGGGVDGGLVPKEVGNGLEENSRRALWKERLGDMRDGVEREAIVHGLSRRSCWRGMGGWSCGLE
jgi:hypothetical protein